MQSKLNKPIFVVGSPRSGTSILTWCLGQHPNIFPVPESSWMGEFTRDVAAAHRIGSARGELSILSAMEIDADEFFASLGQSINDLVLQHREHLQTKRERRAVGLKIEPRWLEAASTRTGPKGRWVDGTPEYAFYISGLRKLFPGALFIHLVRDVDSVVRSMLNFHRVAGTSLVASEEEAFDYWLRAVKACLKAEEAYGPQTVYRLWYSSLTSNPEAAMRRLLDFLGEPYHPRCLEPLAVRINSSEVAPDLQAGDTETSSPIGKEARRLFAAMEQTTQPAQGSAAAMAQLETEFWEPRLNAEQCKEELTNELRNLQRQHVAEVEEYKSQVCKLQKEYAATTRTLMRMLGDVERAAARLRDSRRWKLVNLGRVIKAKLSRDEELPGYGNLDEVVAAYSQWRAATNTEAGRESVNRQLGEGQDN